MAVSEEQKKSDIKELQEYLNTVGGEGGTIPHVIPDGVYGEDTRNAVSIFQQENGLPVTGEVDEETWRELLRAYNAIIRFYAEPEPVRPFSRREIILERGDSGNLVYIVQAMLDTVGQFYDNLDSPPVNGVFGDETAAAVKQLQGILGMEETGKFDRAVWNGLARLYNFHALIDNSLKLAEGDPDENTPRETNENIPRTPSAASENSVQTISSVG